MISLIATVVGKVSASVGMVAMKWTVVSGVFVLAQANFLAQDIGLAPDGIAEFADKGFAIVLGVAFMWAVLTGRVRFHDQEDAMVRDQIRTDIRETKGLVEQLVAKQR